MKSNIKSKLKKFSEQWKDRGYEKGETQPFWLELLGILLGKDATDFIRFEEQVHLDNTSFMDGYIDSTHVLIEQKSLGKSLSAPIRQSDGSMLTPFQQAKRYAAELPYSMRPRWIVTCNFGEFYVYDMENPNAEAQVIKLSDLEKEYYRLSFLTDTGNEHLKKELQISKDAGDLVGKLYDAFLEQYKAVREPTEDDYKSLNILCVRLVFCFYAEDAELFGHRSAFRDYVESYDTTHLRTALIELFKVLNTPDGQHGLPNKRDPFLDETLRAFPYVNGGLFGDENIIIPQINENIRNLIIQSSDFDWNGISPTIFGACFESTLNPETRRSGGMHYTSIENIHKVIDPLFLDDLKEELDEILAEPNEKKQLQRLDDYQNKLAGLKFLDPACGSGNFLTETYLELRKLENRVIEERISLDHDQITGQVQVGIVFNPIIVSIQQFYGIEINDYAVSVAMTALWIAEAQMMEKTREIVHQNLDFLPLETFTNIHKENALRVDWENIISKYELDYIIGNPPFVGTKLMNKAQKEDTKSVIGKWKNFGTLDYVSCWYKKAADMMIDSNIKAALVSTNSICQGEQVANMWEPLMNDGLEIDFAHRTFIWNSEANLQAHVHCVVIGFSMSKKQNRKYIFENGSIRLVRHINPYLVEGDTIFVHNQREPICPVPAMFLGCDFKDDNNYVLTDNEHEDLIKNEPQAAKYIRPYVTGRDFINRKPRHCLWLNDANPTELKNCPMVLERVKKVHDFRQTCPSEDTNRYADMPLRPARLRYYSEERGTDCLGLPRISSQTRRYLPMEIMSAKTVGGASMLMIPDMTLYLFGILESNVHMAWMRTVCGRMKSDYRYSNGMVYNTFPWPNPTEEQKKKIEHTAQAILDARDKYPNANLADLYGEQMYLYSDLLKAHQANDKAVWEAYGKAWDIKSESDCVAYLMKEYQRLTGGDK